VNENYAELNGDEKGSKTGLRLMELIPGMGKIIYQGKYLIY
jgi:hypothetical protein